MRKNKLVQLFHFFLFWLSQCVQIIGLKIVSKSKIIAKFISSATLITHQITKLHKSIDLVYGMSIEIIFDNQLASNAFSTIHFKCG